MKHRWALALLCLVPWLARPQAPRFEVTMILDTPCRTTVRPGPFQVAAAADLACERTTKEQIRQVQRFARQYGLTLNQVRTDSHVAMLEGTSAAFERAFGVILSTNGHGVRICHGGPTWPPGLGATAVLGLSNNALVRPEALPQPGPRVGYWPTQLARLYHFPQGVDGSGQTIGILEFGGNYQAADLQRFFTEVGVPAPSVSRVQVDGGEQKKPAPEDIAEVDLDIEIAGAVAPGARIVVYFAPNSERGYVDALNTAVHDAKNHPNVLSLSWGTPEDGRYSPPPSGWSAAGRTTIDHMLFDAARRGINVFTASGDFGSRGDSWDEDGGPHVEFPASSPWAIAVGGTSLFSDVDGHVTREVGWRDAHMASGGGVSRFFRRPEYQQHIAMATPWSHGGRAVPDVAASAANDDQSGNRTTGYQIVAHGQEWPTDGTSCAVPLYAGLAALLGQAVGRPLGFLNPFFYAHPEVFHDITTGSNGAYQAGPGWDAVTGLGSPDGSRMVAALRAAAAAPYSK